MPFPGVIELDLNRVGLKSYDESEDHLAAIAWNAFAIMHHQELRELEWDDMAHYLSNVKENNNISIRELSEKVGIAEKNIENNISKLKELFPEVLTEGKIDFKILQDILGNEIEIDEEEVYVNPDHLVFDSAKKVHPLKLNLILDEKIPKKEVIKMMEENNRQGALKREKMKADALATSTSMNEMVITIATKAGANGKIFGSVTAMQLAQSLVDRGFDIDKRKIILYTTNDQTNKYGVFFVKDVLRGICESSNFEVIKQRIGQTLQIGFALSSDIWVTNLLVISD